VLAKVVDPGDRSAGGGDNYRRGGEMNPFLSYPYPERHDNPGFIVKRDCHGFFPVSLSFRTGKKREVVIF
jgi:hypothetical protein